MDMLQKASEIVDLFQTLYCRSDGLLGRKADCIKGQLLDASGLVDEIGDYCQYTIQLGVETGSQSHSDWGLNQVIQSMASCQQEDGLVYNRDDQSKRARDFFPTIRMGDTLWGLQETYRLTGDHKTQVAFDRLSDRILRSGLICGAPSYGIYRLGTHYFPLPIAEPMTSGYLGESLVEMYNTTGKEAYLQSARQVLNSWQPQVGEEGSVVFLRKTATGGNRVLDWAIDRQFKLRGRPGLDSNILTKGDVFLLFAWLALYRVDRDPDIARHLSAWVEYIVFTMSTEDGRFFNHYDVRSGKRSSVKLEENHSIIELLIDISVELGNEQALDTARRCALAWHGRRSKAGLIANIDGEYWAEIDPFLDLLVNTAKLGELSRESSLGELFEQGIHSLLENFGAEYGYVQRTRLDGSGPVNGDIELKYMGLLVKGLLLVRAVQEGTSLFDTRQMRLLATDR
jgi:hypothetical protein